MDSDSKPSPSSYGMNSRMAGVTRGLCRRREASAADVAQKNARAINTTKYAGDPELRRQKQAEILVPDFLPFDKVLDILAIRRQSSRLAASSRNSAATAGLLP